MVGYCMGQETAISHRHATKIIHMDDDPIDNNLSGGTAVKKKQKDGDKSADNKLTSKEPLCDKEGRRNY